MQTIYWPGIKKACAYLCVCLWFVFTSRSIKSKWWGACCCSDLGALLGWMIKRSRGVCKRAKVTHKQKHAAVNTDQAPLRVPRSRLHRNTESAVSLLLLSGFLAPERSLPQSWERRISSPFTPPVSLSLPCGGVVIEIMVCLSGSDNRYPGASGTRCLIN